MIRPLTPDGRDLCAEAFERMRAERAAPERVVDLGPAPEPEVRARPAEPGELPKNAASLIRDAEKRRWAVTASYARGSALTTVMVEDVGAPLTPTGRIARKASTGWKAVDSVVLRCVSPWGDRVVLLFEGGSCVDAWVARRGDAGFRPAGYKGARSFLFGPWEAGMTYTPAWQRDKIEDRKRLARKGNCSRCGAEVVLGIDQAGGEQPVTADAEPLVDEFTLLTEVAYYLTGRGVYTGYPGGGGFELHRRDPWTVGERRWPTYAEHVCSEHLTTEARSAA